MQRLPLFDSALLTQPNFRDVLAGHGQVLPDREPLHTVQVNLGKVCNQACLHCHVEAGPKRTESMSQPVMDRVLELIERSEGVRTVDITGGAPELHPRFRWLVTQVRAMGLHVIDRCNLTILSEPGQEDLALFLADNEVEIAASLPCYSAKNVDAQRGKGVFGRSISGLQQLNALGYGQQDGKLQLKLVYNPGGPSLPPDQAALEEEYRRRLQDDFGVQFSQLLTITNMPINRFLESLKRKGQLRRYIQLLEASFNHHNLSGLMCRSQVSISYDGMLFDCDFNQMLQLPVGLGDVTRTNSAEQLKSVSDIEHFDELRGGAITTATHCLGCTAGAGSSCGGALAAE